MQVPSLPAPNFPESDRRSGYHGWVIAVVGPPRSGKSIFLAELYRQLLQHWPTRVFLHRACPDGEGMWSSEANPELVQQIRKKSEFSAEFMVITLQAIDRLGCNPTHAIVLLDLGGKRTPENVEMLRRATHCIVLSSSAEEIAPWSALAIAANCKILAELHSHRVYDSSDCLDQTARSTLQPQQIPLQGTIINLCRNGPNDCYREAIATLVAMLLQWLEPDRWPLRHI
jgi:CRISPR-associated protein Csx3